jgi:hypothetical protein
MEDILLISVISGISKQNPSEEGNCCYTRYSIVLDKQLVLGRASARMVRLEDIVMHFS